MLARERLENYLTINGVQFEAEPQPRAVGALEAGAEPGAERQLTKVVMLVVDGRAVMAVLAASRAPHLEQLPALLGAHEVRLAGESEFAPLFPDCEVGAMPPFGNLYCVPVYVDEPLSRHEEIVIAAGSHDRTVRLRYFDFARLTQPVVTALSNGAAGRTGVAA